ncbi:MAG: ATP synthase subunit I [Candidatus Aminicenantes bacterium]|nr:ATP synthase subunit I [Candidatus Aminicenantes bacterium]
MTSIPPPDDSETAVLRRIPLEILTCGAVFGLAGLVFWGPLQALFILLGGGAAAASFLGLRRSLEDILARDRKRALRRGVLLYALRILLILAVFSLIILFYPKMVLPFALGFSAIVAVFLYEAVRSLARLRQWKP